MITQINTLKTLIYPVSAIFKKGTDDKYSRLCNLYSLLQLLNSTLACENEGV